MNAPLDLPRLPPEAVALLDDPRLMDMKDARPGFPRARRTLEPRDPPKRGESRYLMFGEENRERFGDIKWVNEPQGLAFHLRTGPGLGFPLVTGRPRLEESIAKPRVRAQVFFYRSWWVASSVFVDILRRFDPGAFETLEIDWLFADGQRLDGYVFVDVTRRIHAYDYARTAVIIEIEKGQKRIARLGLPKALKQDIDSALHAFRDAYHRSDVFMSRALAKTIVDAGMPTIRFEDPVSTDTVRF
jgi:hypothetical protein